MILIDSGVFIAAVSAKDAHHEQAKAILADVAKGTWGAGLVPEYVFVETVNYLVRKRGFAVAAAFARGLLSATELTLVPSKGLFPRALAEFLGQRGTAFSFTDSALVSLAKGHAIRTIATFDSDFRSIPGVRIVSGPDRTAS